MGEPHDREAVERDSLGERVMIPVAVVAHHSRRRIAEQLAHKLNAVLFMDEGDADDEAGRVARSLANHERAWAWAADQEQRCIIVEDDVQPVADMFDRAAEWFDRFPDDLLNLYLGTGWDMIEAASVAALDAYDLGGPDHIRLPTMWGAQAYSIPTAHIPAILADHRRDLAGDFALGASWIAHHGRDVVHVLESLVDHDTIPSAVWAPGARPLARRARRLHQATS